MKIHTGKKQSAIVEAILLNHAKIGILAGSVIAGSGGYFLLRRAPKRTRSSVKKSANFIRFIQAGQPVICRQNSRADEGSNYQRIKR